MKFMKYIFLICLFLPFPLLALDVLKPVNTETPQDTLRTFMKSMESYREGVEEEDENKQQAIQYAVQTLNLDQISPLISKEFGKKSAVYLKEVIDRVLIVDYSKVPPGKNAEALSDVWRLAGTDIKIEVQHEGPRKGEYLFSAATVNNAKSYFDVVRNYPYVAKPGGAGYQDSFIEKIMPKGFKSEFLGFPKWQILGIFIAILLGFLVKYIVEGLIILGKKFATYSQSQWDDKLIEAVEGPIAYCTASGFWFLALYVMRIEGVVLQVLSSLIQIILSISIIWLFYRLAAVWSGYISLLTQKTEFVIDDRLLPLVTRATRILIVVFGGLIALQNLGINVVSVIAGLGLGGLALALAAKDTAANLFGSLMILSDRPFKLGDWVQFGNIEGTVEDVGFRSTRVRTFYDSVVTVPNAVIANANIDNMGRRTYRRVKAVLGITYSTTPEQLEAFLEGIKKIIQANSYTRKDYFHVIFNDYGPSSLHVLVYFFLKVPDWAEELLQKQNIFIEIKRLARDLNVNFAFPSQSLYVESFPGQAVTKQDIGTSEQLLATAHNYSLDGTKSKPQGLGLFTAPYKEDAQQGQHKEGS